MDKLISIVIATFNAERVVARCLDSIISQKRQSLELILIDGDSQDNTIEIIQKNSTYIDFFISEPDKGIYDAWNKGIRVSCGKWIMFLGSDDILLPDAIDNYIQFIETHPIEKFDIISSKLDYVDKKGRHLKYVGKKWEWIRFQHNGMMMAHPGMLHNRKFFDKYGLYDISYQFCGDYELLLRAGSNLKDGFMDILTVKMQHGGASFSIKAIKETNKAKYITGHQNLLYCIYSFCVSIPIYYRCKLKIFLKNLFD
jgi:glycosyltransferase involved in cell wall biosynthesis